MDFNISRLDDPTLITGILDQVAINYARKAENAKRLNDWLVSQGKPARLT
jgi:hypothetical protein